MTIWTDLQTEIDAKITALGYTGTLDDLGIDQPYSPTLEKLLNLQAQLSEIIGGATSGGALLQTQVAITQLTAPSSSAAVSMAGYGKAAISILAASINTNVVVRVEVSNDAIGTNWDNASATNADTTLTPSAPYKMFFLVGCPQYIRVTFVSESGGTTATVDAVVRLSS
jgi:hypothetical protein